VCFGNWVKHWSNIFVFKSTSKYNLLHDVRESNIFIEINTLIRSNLKSFNLILVINDSARSPLPIYAGVLYCSSGAIPLLSLPILMIMSLKWAAR
jgi:hypothetical protein